MADAPFPPIDRELAARLDSLVPPALPGDFAARLMAAAQATPQVAPHALLPTARWRAIGRRARFGIAAGSLALIGLGSVSAAAAGFLGEPVNHAVHKLPVVGKLIEKVIPEKRRHHHAEAAHAAGLRHATAHETPGRLKAEPRPAAADVPPLVALPPPPFIVGPGGLRTSPPWRYPGPLPRTFPPGPERRAAIAAFRAFRAAHPLPPEVIAARQRRQAAIRADRRAIWQVQGLAGPQRRRLVPPPPPDPLDTAVPPPAFRGPRFERGIDPMLDPTLDSGAHEQLRLERRLERRRARIEARRMGLDPLPPRFLHRRFGPRPDGGQRWRD